MKFYKSKTAKFLAGKGFYLVLAVCMAAMGIAVYSALDASDIIESEESSNISENAPSIVIPSVPIEQEEEEISSIITQQPESQEEMTEPVDNNGVATFFMLPLNGEIIKHHDEQYLQYSSTYNDMRLHIGTDIKPVSSNQVASAGDGNVTNVEENTVYGNVVTIDHGNGIVIRYCGIKNIAVATGSTVSAGDIIGEVGTVTNECSDEEHIHLEVFKNSKAVDPAEFFSVE